ncbi:hypothetical protein BRADI_1g56063v3 [Brachypodium distachyon]|uniref:Uncharacterized protein n=1 Tax=Brachypodium distachyon TaxID=15368 RepID=A0A2K2DRN6_BRADI|nr:hypothetical protein BRADI_1g56063v3 [Brachypodium distachyon]
MATAALRHGAAVRAPGPGLPSPASASASASAVNVSSAVAAYVADVVVRAVAGDRIRDGKAFLASLDEGIKVGAGFSLAGRVEAVNRQMNRLMDGVIEDKRARRAAGAGDDDEEDILDVLLRTRPYEEPLELAPSVPSSGERVLGDDAAACYVGADAEPRRAPESPGGGGRRARRAEPRQGGGAAGAEVPAAGDQGDAPAARAGAAAAPAGVHGTPPRAGLRRAAGRHGAGQRVGDLPGHGRLERRRRGVQKPACSACRCLPIRSAARCCSPAPSQRRRCQRPRRATWRWTSPRTRRSSSKTPRTASREKRRRRRRRHRRGT